MLFFFSACDITDSLDREPYDSVSETEAIRTVGDVERVTTGNYSMIITDGISWGMKFPRYLHEFSEYPSDDVSLSGTTSAPLWNAYSYTPTADLSSIEEYWEYAYRVIYGANRVIHVQDDIEAETDAEQARMEQAVGENYFLRAFMHFKLSNVFGRPYTHGASENLSVPYIDVPGEDVENPMRNTVEEVYEFIIADLERSIELMNEDRPSPYASREVAYAFLSRIYLYMEEYEEAMDYADLVINSGRYDLVDQSDYPDYFTFEPEDNPETIFALKHTVDDDIPSPMDMYYQSPEGDGWGEMYASEEYRNLLHEDDLRGEFIQPNLDEDGNIQERNGFPQYFILKYTYQNDVANLSSPVMARLAEMYLNRAEANAQLGNDTDALNDVNLIRERAGLSGDQLYSDGDLQGHDSVLDVVLEERRLELAFEGHRKFDVFRHRMTMDRDYPGTHHEAPNAVSIEWDDPRVIFPLPEREMDLNPNLEQNPM